MPKRFFFEAPILYVNIYNKDGPPDPDIPQHQHFSISLMEPLLSYIELYSRLGSLGSLSLQISSRAQNTTNKLGDAFDLFGFFSNILEVLWLLIIAK